MKLRTQVRVLATVGVAAAAGVVGGAPPGVADSCPSYNPPNEMTLGGGTPQSARLGTAFATNLQVGLANTDGCSITTSLSGIAVTFAAPGGGPSGTFASSGANAVLVGTDSAGNATAPQFTANMLAGGYLVTASSTYGSVTFSLVNTAVGVAASIEQVSSTGRSAAASTQYTAPLQVRVLDTNGNPVQGASVSFSLDAADGAGATFAGGMTQATAVSNVAGVATSPAFTANADAGRFTAVATIEGLGTEAVFALRNLAARPPAIDVVGSPHMSATIGKRFPRELEVKVLDGSGKPVQGASVAFSLGGGASGSGSAAGAGATFADGSAQATEATNASGIASSPRFSANTAAGTFTATATTAGTTKAAAFTLRNAASKPHTITAGVAASEATAPGSAFPVPLAATVDDAHGNPVAGAVVTFTAPARGPSGHFRGEARSVEVKTDAEGVAVAPAFVAGHASGGYVVRATVHGVSGAAAFALVNQSA